MYDALASARAFGFLGPGPIEDHIEHAGGFVQAIGPFEGRGLDLGSGGGIPGLVLAATYDQSEWILLDSSRRRTAFLSDQVARLGWHGRVRVLRARAEDAGHDPALRATCELVTARSFGPPARTAECGAAFLVPGGRLVVAEPPDDGAERWEGSERAGLTLVRLHEGQGGRMAVLERSAAELPDLPRPGRSLRRPLF